MQKIDLAGQQFGRWTVISDTGERRNGIVYLCRCDCGNTKNVRVSNLRSKSSQSCGCLLREALKKRKNTKKPIDGIPRHDQPLYSVYNNILSRCYNPKDKAYMHYGGRGITVCAEWKYSYPAFKDWALSNGYEYFIDKPKRERLSIDRIDNDGNYEPSNCRWIPMCENIAKRNMSQRKGGKHGITFIKNRCC